MNTLLRSVPLGRYRGVALGAHWSTLVVVILIAQAVAMAFLPVAAPGRSPVSYWLAGVLAALAFMVSLLVHELAHARVANRYGIEVRRIDLWLLGGATELTAPPPTPRADLLLALAGPGASAAVGVVAAVTATALDAAGAPPLVVSPLMWLGVANVLLAGFNLVPAAPLDGGRVLRAIVWWRTGEQARGERAAAFAGRAFGLVLVALGAGNAFSGRTSGLWLVLVGVFLVFAASAEQSYNEVRHRLDGVLVRDVMRTDPPVAPAWWTVDRFLRSCTADRHQRVFPVVSSEAAPMGVVSLTDLVSVPDQAHTTVSDVARDVPVALPGEPLLDVLGRGPLTAGRDIVPVLDDGVLTGVLDAEDVAWATEISRAVRLGDRETSS
ncbi:site-2 protease family protein [Lentzea sp. HUAS TT2]|uniref:site-2 protease family protein n=1 Tax=Lentzea sp. HUAS TT2 TaxID=3447454 RepID=UPI003F70CAAA